MLSASAEGDSHFHMKASVKKEASQQPDLRSRKKNAMMRQVQRIGLDLFEKRGFDSVTIEEVAAAATVSAPTIYRHFATKEGIVLWDDYDPTLFRALGELLKSAPLLEAVRNAVARPLDKVYAADAGRMLQRARLVTGHAGLRVAFAANLRVMQGELARMFLAAGVCRDELEAEVVAGATMTAVDVAMDHWARANGKWPLLRFVDQALRRLRRLAEDDRKGARSKTRKR